MTANVIASVAVSALLLLSAFAVAGLAEDQGAGSVDETAMSMPTSTLILMPADVPRDRGVNGPHCFDPSLWD